MKSTPDMTALAMAGAEAITMMNRIEELVSPNRMIANGIHAADGKVCMPVISEPTAARSGGTRATRRPTTVPMTRAIP